MTKRCSPPPTRKAVEASEGQPVCLGSSISSRSRSRSSSSNNNSGNSSISSSNVVVDDDVVVVFGT